MLEGEGLEIHAEANPRNGIKLAQQLRPEIILLDLMMPGVRGMDVLEESVEVDPGTNIILMMGHYSTESAVEAIHKGASDYLPKPFSAEKLRHLVRQFLEEAKATRRQTRGRSGREFRVGRVERAQPAYARNAPNRRVLSLCPGHRSDGLGQRAVARALHRLSPVGQGLFVAANCSSISETLAESELFGHTREAFTGAIQGKVGVFEYANSGCALLDEVGDMPLPMQAKLLRVLQNREVQRVGSPAVLPRCPVVDRLGAE